MTGGPPGRGGHPSGEGVPDRFTWETCAQATLSAYHRALEARR